MTSRRAVLVFMFVGIVLPMVAESPDINWYSKYDSALAVAQREEKNIFVLITAPSWCGYCVQLEENVLSTDAFKEYVAANYIPLMLLDVVNGERNPELANFDFSGYPTVRLYDSIGNLITDSYTQNPDQMLRNLQTYVEAEGTFRPLLADLILPEKYIISNAGGLYENNRDGTWSVTIPSGTVVYTQSQYDYDYLYLEHPTEELIIALSMSGTDAHTASPVDGKWVWSDLDDVFRVGGDPYYD